jgi:hypothetical protein
MSIHKEEGFSISFKKEGGKGGFLQAHKKIKIFY